MWGYELRAVLLLKSLWTGVKTVQIPIYFGFFQSVITNFFVGFLLFTLIIITIKLTGYTLGYYNSVLFGKTELLLGLSGATIVLLIRIIDYFSNKE